MKDTTNAYMTLGNHVSVLKITQLGHQGDGLAETPTGMIAIPYTLPGETVRARLCAGERGQGECIEIIEFSPHRVQPPCPHFGICGGCRLQHLDQQTYADFKRQKIVNALMQQGLNPATVQNPVLLPPNSRRRVALKAMRTQNQMSLGYYQRQSHKIVDVQVCPLVVPAIEALIEPLRQFLFDYLKAGQKLEVWVTQADQGLDVVLRYPKDTKLSLDQTMDLTEFARNQGLCRLTHQTPKQQQLIVCFQEPTVSFAGVPVGIDAASFLQTSTAADQVLAELVTRHIDASTKRIADLFCGRGTLTLPLAEHCKIDGFEMELAPLTALENATRQHQKPITLFERDLFNDPLCSQELQKYDLVVLDPPRVGAVKQVKQLAKSQVPRLVMVSCNPASFARDAKILEEGGGYALEQVTPVDQFLWSNHVELVAMFDK